MRLLIAGVRNNPAGQGQKVTKTGIVDSELVCRNPLVFMAVQRKNTTFWRVKKAKISLLDFGISL